MTTIAREKTYKAVQFLNSVSLDVLRQEYPEALADLAAKIAKARGMTTETIDLRIEGAAAIAAASEALDKVEEHVRRALCGVIDRLGADGVCAFINGDSAEDLADGISMHVSELEARAKAHVEVERDNALTKLDVAGEVITEVRGVCKAAEDELTVAAVRRALRTRDEGAARLRAAIAQAIRLSNEGRQGDAIGALNNVLAAKP